jgi:hypothetical protein
MDERAERAERFRQHFTSRMLAKKPDTFAESVEALEVLPRPDPPATESLRTPLTAQPAGPAPNFVAGLPHEGPLPGRDVPYQPQKTSAQIEVDKAELARWKERAQAEGKSLSAFVRDVGHGYVVYG